MNDEEKSKECPVIQMGFADIRQSSHAKAALNRHGRVGFFDSVNAIRKIQYLQKALTALFAGGAFN